MEMEFLWVNLGNFFGFAAVSAGWSFPLISLLTVLILMRIFQMRKSKKPKTQAEIIKSIRRELPPKGQTFQVKKDKPFRKRKHKGKIDSED